MRCYFIEKKEEEKEKQKEKEKEEIEEIEKGMESVGIVDVNGVDVLVEG